MCPELGEGEGETQEKLTLLGKGGEGCMEEGASGLHQ
jgi:hypothetical protein